ncbi:MAG: hypothetical protein OEL53_12455 [Rhodospirillales bacterium]|nr:hypothetical protein [Rhodospirillales bacterium]
MTTLFGFLAAKFAASPENLAIEALNYLLVRSKVANTALLGLLEEAGVDLPDDVAFQTQVTGGDDARPDIEGRTAERGTIIVVETKFWAGLTDNQPVTYLYRLPEIAPALLVFVAPAARFTTLWPELIGRCRSAGFETSETKQVASELWCASLPKGRHLMLVSWRAVLADITRALERAGEGEAVADAEQLAGLCEAMDSEAFMPLRSEELTSVDIPRRFVQFAQLALDIAARACEAGICSKDGGLRPGSSSSYSGHFLRLGGVLVFLCFDSPRWARHRSTPLWLRIQGKDMKERDAARHALGRLRLENPPRLIEDEGYPWVPLPLPLGTERERIIDNVLSQLEEIGGLLKRVGEPA